MSKTYRIVHLDDNPVFIELTKMLIDEIKEINIDYKGVYRKQDAYNLIKSDIPDLFISDLMLEDEHDAETGAQVVKTVSEKYPYLKIMALSARSDASLKERLEKYTIRYETKDFQPSLFPDTIKDILTQEDADG
jgi:CheY-like chemotaxis protein